MDIEQVKPHKNGRYKQGYINPSSCKKLFPQLKHTPIIYRSSYERDFIYWMENDRNVKFWGSECVEIPYYYIDEKIHTYYPDYFLEMEDGTYMLVEIKPYNQTQKPVNENAWGYREYTKNMCKWKAAKEFCDSKGYKFRVFTEKTISRL